MRDFITKSKERIRQVIDFLAVNRKPIAVKIEGEQTLFDSKILKVDHGDPASKAGTVGRVFIQWLSPAKGNDVIQSASPVQVRCSLGKYKLAFTSYYITKGLESPYLGHIITYPESLVIADRRRQDRREVDSKAKPLFAKAKISMRAGGSQGRVYDFRVFDVSETGVGILVGEELFDWLERIGIGDRLEEVELYAPWTIVRVDGTVRHKSRMHKGKYSGYHLLGIELDEKLEHYA
jgi:sulfur carrier protein ThiS